MQSTPRHAQPKSYWIFLLTLSLFLMVIGGIVTSRYGAGVASDSTKYLSVAQSVLDGRGLFDHRDKPLLSWPPLYSILIAGLSRLTNLDVFVAAWYLNIFVLGLNLFLSGVILQRVFPYKPLYAYLGVIFIFLSNPNLRIHSVISSDTLYLTTVLLLTLALDAYILKRSVGSFLVILLLSALTPLLRYVGLAIGVTAGLVILIENRRSFRTILREGFVLGLVTILPIAWWLIVHNVMTYGSLWGLSSQPVDASTNLWMGFTKILHWFVPYFSFLMPVLLRPWIVIIVLVVLLFLINRSGGAHVREWVDALRAKAVYPTLIHAVVYYTAVTLTILSADHRDLYSDRYYFILLVPILILLFITFDKFILPHLHFSPRQVSYGLMILFALWSAYPLYSMVQYVREARAEGEPSSYNMFNTRAYNEMELIAEAKRLREREPNAVVYSNYVDALWFHTRRPATLLPFVNEDPAGGYGDWPGNKSGYVVWFEPNEYKHYISPEIMAKFANVELVYQGTGGKIYYVQAR